MVKLDPADARMPVLQWYPIRRGQEDGGELLAAFELFLVGVKCIFVTLRSTEGTNYINRPTKRYLLSFNFISKSNLSEELFHS